MWMTKDPAFIRTTSKLRAVAAHSTAVNMDSAQPLSYFFFSTPDGLDSQLQSLISSILLCILRLASLSIICSKSAEAFQRIFKMRSYFRMHAHSFIWLLQAVAIDPFHPGIRRITNFEMNRMQPHHHIEHLSPCPHIEYPSRCYHIEQLCSWASLCPSGVAHGAIPPQGMSRPLLHISGLGVKIGMSKTSMSNDLKGTVKTIYRIGNKEIYLKPAEQ